MCHFLRQVFYEQRIIFKFILAECSHVRDRKTHLSFPLAIQALHISVVWVRTPRNIFIKAFTAQHCRTTSPKDTSQHVSKRAGLFTPHTLSDPVASPRNAVVPIYGLTPWSHTTSQRFHFHSLYHMSHTSHSQTLYCP